MTVPRPRVLVDVSQYATWPATSGVQRVLLHLAAAWEGDHLDAHFGLLDGRRYMTGPFRVLEFVIRATFLSKTAIAPEDVRAGLRDSSAGYVRPNELERSFDAYLLPEPTFCRESLDVLRRLAGPPEPRAFCIYYDAIPLTHPEYFPDAVDTDGSVTRYHRALARLDDIAFISPATRELFEQRVARRSVGHGRVIALGCDGLGVSSGSAAPEPLFTVLGTVEPRKRHSVVLDAFEALWAAGAEYRLLILGAPGAGQPEVLDRIHRLEATGRLDWIQDADDAYVVDAVSRSLGVLFVPAVEGSGLPALEALALGCPVIAAADVPALSGIEEAGQIRLRTVTAESVARAVETLADPRTNREYRNAITELRLPTWSSFALGVETWIAERLQPHQHEGAITVVGP